MSADLQGIRIKCSQTRCTLQFDYIFLSVICSKDKKFTVNFHHISHDEQAGRLLGIGRPMTQWTNLLRYVYIYSPRFILSLRLHF